MTAPLGLLRQAALNPARLARQAVKEPRLIAAIIDGLGADKPRIKYGCSKALRLMSELRPDLLYPQFDFFVRLLDHGNKIMQWEGVIVLSHLVRADVDDKFPAIFAKYFSPIRGPVMITAANVIQGGARIAEARPAMADRIGDEILKVSTARYQTSECRNVAIGHAIVALGALLPLLHRPAAAVRFVRRQLRNSRPATRKKAERFLRSSRGALAQAG